MQDNLERLRQHEPFFDIWRLSREKPLGVGNSGVVYLITDGVVESALKVISLPKDEEQLQNLYDAYGSPESVNAVIDREYQFAVQEIEIMRKLKGLSNIVCFEDSKAYPREDTHGWDIIIRMERLIQLTDDLKKSMKRDQIMKMWVDLVTGLFYCERNGIVHLDIKPDNIFYTGANMNLYKLGDFGVSIRTENGKVSEGVMQGSPAYMSPEIYHGKGGDIRSDIYSLAIVIYELFNNNCLPFMTKNSKRGDLDASIRHRCTPGQEIPPIKSLDSRLSHILMRCLRYSPDERYQTVRELHEDLQQYLLGGRPAPNKLLRVLLGIGAAGVIGAAAFILLQPSSKGALTFVGPVGVVDTGNRFITINGQTVAGAELRLRGSKKSQVNFRIVDRATGSVRVDRSYVLDENGEQTVWRYGEDALEDGSYDFISWYADQSNNQETFEALVDTVAPESPAIEGDAPYAGAPDWPLSVSAEPGSAVSLLADGVEADTRTADERGAVTFVYTYAPEVRYTLVARDAVGNESAGFGFSAAEKQVLAGLTEVGEDDESMTITAEAGGSVLLTVNDAPVDGALLRRESDTEYVYSPEYGFTAGDWYKVTVTDAYGLQGTADCVVVESTRSKIALEIANTDAQGVVRDMDIVVNGTAENGDVVWLTWNGQRIGGEIPVLDGEFTGYLSMEDAGVGAGGADGAVAAVYQFGAASRASDPVSVRWEPAEEERPEVVDYREIDIAAMPELPADASETWLITGDTAFGAEIGLFNGARGQEVACELIRDGETVETDVIKLSSTSGAATMNLDIDALPDGEYTLAVRYQDAPEAGEWRQSFLVDRTPPEIVLDDATPYADVDWTMEILAEPGASLSMSDAAGEEVWSGVADEDGMAELSYRFEAGTDYRLTAVDGYGNTSEPLIIRAEEKHVLARIDDVYEDSDRLTFDIDPDYAGYELLLNGAALDAEALTIEAESDAGVRISWQPPEGKFDKDDVFTLEVTDVYGLTNSAEAVVREANWAQLGLSVDNIFEADGVVYDDVLRLTLTGEPGASVELLWDGETIGEPLELGEGALEAALGLEDVGLGETGGTGVLSARYAFGYAESKGFEGAEVVWTPDDAVRIEVSRVSEDSEAMSIATDPDAQLDIEWYRQGELLDSWHIEDVGDGAVEWQPDDGRFIKDDTYVVAATDHIGNRDSVELTVSGSSRADIALSVSNAFDWEANGVEPFYDLPTVIDGAVRVTGTAEPGQRVALYWNDAPLRELDVDASGGFACDMTDYTDEMLEHDGIAGTLRAEYADGRTPSLTAAIELRWKVDDGAYLDEADGALQLYWGGTLNIHTEPYAQVEVNFDGKSFALGAADETGVVTWTPDFDYEIGTPYEVTVTDIFGHTYSSGMMRVEEIQRADITVQAEGLAESSYGETGFTGDTLSLTGTAEPETALEVDVNGRALAVETSADGRFSAAVSRDIGIQSGDTVEITLRYADGASASRTASLAPFVWDWSVDYSINGPITEDTPSLVLSATEPVAATLYYCEANGSNWLVVGTQNASAEQAASWSLGTDYSWTRGDLGRVVVADRWGNSDTVDFVVGSTALADIRAEIAVEDGRTLDGLPVVTVDTLTVRGTAEPGQALWAELYNDSGASLAFESLEADAQGEYSVDFAAEALGDGYDESAAYYAIVGYPWDQTRVYTATGLARWDYMGPDVAIVDAEAVDLNWRSIQGSTQPGARVVMDVDGATLETTAEGGTFEFKRSELFRLVDDIVGKTMTITAYDDSGNPGSPWTMTFEQRSYPGEIVITNQAGDGSVSGALEIEGWFAGFETLSAQVTIEYGTHRNVVRPSYREMTDEEKARYLGDSAGSYGKNTYAFSYSADLSNIPAGECELVLMYSDFDGDQLVASAPFTLVKSAADSNSLMIEDDVAMDVDPVAAGYPGDGVILTGWISQSDNAADTTAVSSARITSVSGNVDSVTVEFEFDQDKSDDVPSVLNGAGYAFVDRDLANTVDAAVLAKVRNLGTSTGRKAGFILNLGPLDLPDGEYTMTVQILGGEAYRMLELGPIRFTVSAGAPKLSAGELSELMDEWRPVVAEPEPEEPAEQP